MASSSQVGCLCPVAPIVAYDKILGNTLLFSSRTKVTDKIPNRLGGRKDRGLLPGVTKGPSERWLHTGVCPGCGHEVL